MKAHGDSIVTIGSVASSIKEFLKTAACGVTKGGVIGLTKAVATDFLVAAFVAVRFFHQP